MKTSFSNHICVGQCSWSKSTCYLWVCSFTFSRRVLSCWLCLQSWVLDFQ